MEWASFASQRGKIIRGILAAGDYDIICVTEGQAELLPSGGFTVESDQDYGCPIQRGRRKVLFWSRYPWRETDCEGSAKMPPGRFVSGITASSIGDVAICGVCIPWRDAHVRSGRRDRRPWDEHRDYLRGLPTANHFSSADLPRLVVGDFNQRIPPKYTPPDVPALLMDTFRDFEIVTGGILPNTGRQGIDHVALSQELEAICIGGWSKIHEGGRRLSDHPGVWVAVGCKRP